jgi:hypothetical protein
VKEMAREDMEKMLSSASHGRLGLCVDNEPYVVPVAFGYMDGKIYIHGAKTGKRVDYVKKNPRVCFEVDEYNPDGSWRSVIIFGHAKLSDETDMKLKGLKALSQKFPGGMRLERATVEKMDFYICEIEVEQMTGRMSRSAHG